MMTDAHVSHVFSIKKVYEIIRYLCKLNGIDGALHKSTGTVHIFLNE